MLTMFLNNPIWVLKTRTMLYFNEKNNKLSGVKLIKETARDMYVNEGIRSFYRGFPISLFLSLYGMISMTTYETTCKFLGYFESNKNEKNSTVPFIAGGASKCLTSCIFYPVNVIKTRQQKPRYSTEQAVEFKNTKKIENLKIDEAMKRPEVHHTTVLQTGKNIFRHEGVAGFYKGLFPNLV